MHHALTLDTNCGDGSLILTVARQLGATPSACGGKPPASFLRRVVRAEHAKTATQRQAIGRHTLTLECGHQIKRQTRYKPARVHCRECWIEAGRPAR